MASSPPTVLVLDHSFIRRLRNDLQSNFDQRADETFNGIVGLTVVRLRRDLRVVSSVGPAVVISRNGHKRPCWPSVRSYRIGDRGVGRFTVEILFLVVGVCEVIPRVRAPLFNDAALVLNQ